MKRKATLFVLSSASLVLLLFRSSAYAYLDPGTGSYLLQIILGVVFGSLMALKIFWNRIKSLFAGKEKDE